jgi:hypothetical protein
MHPFPQRGQTIGAWFADKQRAQARLAELGARVLSILKEHADSATNVRVGGFVSAVGQATLDAARSLGLLGEEVAS